MAAHINAFVPYESLAPSHENSLTRAFLLVLRSVPLAHAAWLDLVDKGHRINAGSGTPRLHALPSARFETQRGALPEQVARVVSVLQTDETYFAQPVGSSSRKQVLDGIVSYAPDLAIVIENKLFSGNVWEGQLNVNLGSPAGGEEVQHDERVACVRWRDVVSAWSNLLQAGHLGGGEKILVEDFLEYVEAHFDRLLPYAKVGMCGRSLFRLERRCRRLLEELAPRHVHEHRGWGTCLQLEDPQAPAIMIGFFPRALGTELALVVEVALGDTVSQARRLYGQCSFERVVALQEAGWQALPNFHCAFMTSNAFYPERPIEPRAYWDLWAREQWEALRQWTRAEFDRLFELLVHHHVAHREDRAQFDAAFTNTQRNKLNVCPGLVMRYVLPLPEATRLDEQGRLVEKVRTEMVRVAESFELRLPPSVRTPGA